MAPLDSPGLSSSGIGQRNPAVNVPMRLGLEIWLHRHGWALPCSALLLMLAGIVVAVRIVPLQTQVDSLQVQLQAAQSRPKSDAAPTRPVAPIPGQALRELLSQADSDPAQVRRIADIARQHGIKLPRGQYSTTSQTPSGITHTDVTLSFMAGYPQSRAFIEQLLRELPNASVDRVSFERDQAQGAVAEVSLKLTLWRWPASPKAEAAR